MIRPIFLLLAALALAAQAPPKSALDKKAMADYVRHLMLYPAHVTIAVSDPKPSIDVAGMLEISTVATAGQATETQKFFVTKDGKTILQGRAYQMANNPFKSELDKLKTDFRPSMGTPGAPIVIVAFSDFQCQYCQKEAESLRTELLKAYPTQVRVYFMDYPLTQIHPWSLPAALSGRCVFNENALAFWDFHDWAFAKQAELTEQNFKEKRDEFLRSKSLDPAKIEACANGPAAMKAVQTSMQVGKDVGVTSTPTLFINGRKLGGYVPFENLKQIIDIEIGYQATAKNAGEACCTLPTPSAIPTQQNPILPPIGAAPPGGRK